MLFLLLLLLLFPLLLLFLLLVQRLLLLQASPINGLILGRLQEALNNSPGQRTSGVSDLRQHGNGKRDHQEREEARGFVYRAVEARDSKWLGVTTCEMLY